MSMRLSYNANNDYSVISSDLWHGARLGDTQYDGLWSCSWFSFAELDSSESILDVAMPQGGWATFNFPSGSSVSTLEYYHNYWAEKVGSPGSITSVIVHFQDGSQFTYGLDDSTTAANGTPPYAGLFYLTSQSDSAGNTVTFGYDSSFNLNMVTAADGTTFAPTYSLLVPGVIVGFTASSGGGASFTYSSPGRYGFFALTGVTDAAGLNSQFVYADIAGDGEIQGGAITNLVTPYGTTKFTTAGDSSGQGIFESTLRITLPNGTQEFYAMANIYTLGDWPDFATSQIPTNTPIGTLDADTGNRPERNTFHWNPQQFAPYSSTLLSSFNWSILKTGRIRHWLASTDPTYTHWDTLSLEQQPSPDGTTEGEITWFDYIGKPVNVDYERGTQIMPSVVARVMPDGTTWYAYSEYNGVGNPTTQAEKWVAAGGDDFRTNLFAYAANGIDLVAWTNALGVLVSSNVFNSYHEVITNYDALGQITTNGYDATRHQLTSTLRPSGLATLYTYDSNHRLQQTVDLPINRTNSYTWYSSGNVQTATDPRGLALTYFWDGLNRLTGTSRTDGTTTNLYYRLDNTAYPNSSGGTNILDPTAYCDRLGHWTYFDFDSLRRQTGETNANGVITRWGYCDCGSVSSVTNAFGNSLQQYSTYNFDLQGHVTTSVGPDSYNVTNYYDSLGRLTRTADGWGSRWFNFNNVGLAAAITNSLGVEQGTIFDLLNRPAYVTNVDSVIVTNTYDSLNRLLTRTVLGAGVEKFGYSARGLIAYTNQVGLSNYFVYDEAGRKTFETNANNELIQFRYDWSGNLTNLIDGKGQSTQWVIDQYNRVTNKLDQGGATVLKYAYDPESRLLSRWSWAKGTTYYTNDAVGNLTYIKYPTSTSVSLSYDALNRLASMVDAAGTTAYAYTAAGQLFTEDGPWSSDTVTNFYLNRMRTNMVVQQPKATWSVGFGYDAAKRLTSVTSPAGTFSYSFSSGSASRLPVQVSLPNTAYISDSYDAAARLTGTYLKNSSSTVLDSYVYAYDPANERTNLTRADSSTVAYRYDKIGQLTVADSSMNSEDRGYKYDAAWNLNYRTNNGTFSTFTVDNKNELTNDPTYADNYDQNGNLTSRYHSGSLAFSYSYDDENRLTSVLYEDPAVGNSLWWRSDYTYDGLGRARRRQDYTWLSGAWYSAGTTLYVYDGMLVIQERNTSYPTVAYTRGSDLSATSQGAGGIGGLLGRSSGYSSSTGAWSTHNTYFADGSGNVTYMLNSSQGMVASYRYDPFGNTISSSGSLASANLYRFSSKEVHANSGMYYYGFRFYDPNLQRWINRDPLDRAAGCNLYQPFENAPVDLLDPWGEDVLDPNSINCLGYATDLGYSLAPDQSQSLKQLLQEYGWTCSGPTTKKCKGKKGQRVIVVYVYKTAGFPPNSDPFKSPWPSSGADFHAIKLCPDKTWRYIPSACPRGTEPSVPSDPNNPDSYWGHQGAPKERYCCTK